MKQHGENPLSNVIVIIPARYDSVRLAGKLMLSLDGKPLILHTLAQARKARNISRVIVAADDERILNIIRESGGEAVLTSPRHQSGSDRIAEVAETLPDDSIIVNVQGDEPLISPRIIERAVEVILKDEKADIATACEKIENYKDVLSPDVVKVVLDENDFALYFSRSPIPFPRESVKRHGSLEKALREEKSLLSLYRKHTGIYVYRREFLLKFTKLKRTNLEKAEMLEQLRALENGAKIKTIEVSEKSVGVDTREDFERVRRILEQRKITYREATAEDIPQIARVHLESWRKSYTKIVSPEYLEKMSIKKRIEAFEKNFSGKDFYKMFVAEDSERGIVGFADFGKSKGESAFEANLYAIYFLRKFQRKGIGGNLFRLCQREMLANNLNSMSLDALEVSPYRAFYEKMGGRIVGEGTHYLAGIEYKTVIYGWNDLRNL